MSENLIAVTRSQGNNRALKEGAVVPAGFHLVFEEVPVLVHAFRRMVREMAYDVSEMALTTYLCAREHGVPFTALPVFLVRGFHHGAILVRRDSGLSEPADLAGRRVGVNRGYTVTTGVWARAIMATEYGLDLDTVTWVLSGDEHVATYHPPANVIPAPAGKDLAQMLVDQELDAVIGVDVEDPRLVPLITDPKAAALAALRQRQLYPINHLVVVKDAVLKRDPGAASAIFEAFAESKRRYVAQLRSGAITEPDAADRLHLDVLGTTGWDDPLPYGLEPNRKVLETLVRQASAQHILREPVDLESVFAPATLDQVG